ncbi:MAG: alpha/beta hydrolase [Pseudonocardia sediminis]
MAVPGLGLSVRCWEPALAALSPHVRGTAVALPAFGAPAVPRTVLGPASSAGRLVARLDALGLDRVVLLGHSASCQVVAETAARHPDRVAALVLVGPTTDPLARSWPALVRRWWRSTLRERGLPLPRLLRDYTYSGMVSFVRALHASRRHRLDRVLTTVTCPVLVLRGTHDHIAPAGWIRRLADATGHGAAASLTAGAHMVPLTHPHELADELRGFLSPQLLRNAG